MPGGFSHEEKEGTHLTVELCRYIKTKNTDPENLCFYPEVCSLGVGHREGQQENSKTCKMKGNTQTYCTQSLLHISLNHSNETIRRTEIPRAVGGLAGSWPTSLTRGHKPTERPWTTSADPSACSRATAERHHWTRQVRLSVLTLDIFWHHEQNKLHFLDHFCFNQPTGGKGGLSSPATEKENKTPVTWKHTAERGRRCSSLIRLINVSREDSGSGFTELILNGMSSQPPATRTLTEVRQSSHRHC